MDVLFANKRFLNPKFAVISGPKFKIISKLQKRETDKLIQIDVLIFFKLKPIYENFNVI